MPHRAAIEVGGAWWPSIETVARVPEYPLLGWFFSLVTGSVLLAFVFRASGGSVLVVSGFHGLLDVAMVNAAMAGSAVTVQGALVTVAGLITAVLLWRRPPPGCP